MAQRIEPPLRSTKTEHPSQLSRKLHQEAPTTPPTRQSRNTFRSPKKMTFIVFFVVVGFLLYLKPSLNEPNMAWAQDIMLETAATFTSLKSRAQAAFGGFKEEALTINTPQENRTNQSEWINEAKRTFFQLSASDRTRIQKWLANNYGYNGALDGLWGPRTEASLLLVRNVHNDVDGLFMTAFRETPAIRQVSRPPVQSGSPANPQQDLQNRIIQLRSACSISPRGSVGERLVDQQLYILTGERCARPPLVFQPIAPIQPNVPTRCTTRPRWSHMAPSITNLEIYCQ